MSNLTPAAVKEIFELTAEAERRSNGSASDRARASVLLSKVASIRAAGFSSDEAREKHANALAEELGLPVVDFSARVRQAAKERKRFRDFLRETRNGEIELRGDGAAGSATVTYSNDSGSTFVPVSFYGSVVAGVRQLTPLLRPDIVAYVETEKGNPLQIPGWDLTTISATKVSENAGQSKGDIPTASQVVLKAYTYKTDPIAASFELEVDSFEPMLAMLSEAYSVGLSRGIGAALANGSGTDEPQGLITGAADSSVTFDPVTGPTVTDLEKVFFAVNRIHRNSPRCGWVMSDKQWAQVRRNAPTAARPMLLNSGDEMALLGRPVWIDPNFGDTIPSSSIVFGNLGRFAVRVGGGLVVKRSLQSIYVQVGQVLYTARMRVDSRVVAPGSDQPLVKAHFTT